MPVNSPPTHAFERSHSIVVAATPRRVFDYVTNPRTWPRWIASSHALECEDLPMRFGDRFHEHWSTRTGAVELDWLVIACDAPKFWIGLTDTPFTGAIVVHYECAAVEGGAKFTRTVRNPARPRPPSPDMIARIDAEAVAALAAIKRNVEAL